MSDAEPITIEASFEITGWDEAPYEQPDEGPRLTRVRIGKRYQGAIEGRGVAEVLTTQGAEGSGYLASERIKASVDGRHVVSLEARRPSRVNSAARCTIRLREETREHPGTRDRRAR